MAWQIEIRENEAGKFNFLVMASNGEVIAASVKRDLTPQDYHDQDFCAAIAGKLVGARLGGVDVRVIGKDGKLSESYSYGLEIRPVTSQRMKH